jgi:hypothetical protein
MWPYFSDYALQGEPSENAVFVRAASPSIPLTRESDTRSAGALSDVAVTFSGYLRPAAPGWHIFQVDVIGRAALYIDGLQRLKVEGTGPLGNTEAAQVYLSAARHELMVRYMSDQPVRRLSVSSALGRGVPAPLRDGLSSGACP